MPLPASRSVHTERCDEQPGCGYTTHIRNGTRHSLWGSDPRSNPGSPKSIKTDVYRAIGTVALDGADQGNDSRRNIRHRNHSRCSPFDCWRRSCLREQSPGTAVCVSSRTRVSGNDSRIRGTGCGGEPHAALRWLDSSRLVVATDVGYWRPRFLWRTEHPGSGEKIAECRFDRWATAYREWLPTSQRVEEKGPVIVSRAFSIYTSFVGLLLFDDDDGSRIRTVALVDEEQLRAIGNGRAAV
jgi:hypothetical protein